MRGTSRFWTTAALGGICLVVGVVAREVTLLVAGTVLGAWALVNQISFVTRASRVAETDVSVDTDRERTAVDDPLPVRLRVDLDAPLPFEATIRPRLSPSADRPRPHPTLALPAGERTAEAAFEVAGTVVGRLTVGPSTVRFRDAGGFFADSVAVGDVAAVDVRPRTPRRVHVGEGGRTVTTLYGEHETDSVGAGTEPYDIREYTPGDRLSHIDWKATARLGYPHIREYERTRSHETVLVVDHRASMGAGPEGGRKLDHLRAVALAFVDTADRFGDPLGLYAAGNDGTTNAREPGTGVDQYDPIRRLVRSLEPTTPDGPETGRDPESPTWARTVAARLDGDRTRFGSALRPYFGRASSHARRLRDQPLFRTVQMAHTHLRSGSWAVILTDDTNPTEVREAAKLARRGDWQVLVFLAPSVLYDSEETGAYDRYHEFEEFRRSLARLDRVSAFEVGPDDRLETILGRQGRGGHRRDARDDGSARPPSGEPDGARPGRPGSAAATNGGRDGE